jgi:hypothetical protein
MSINLSLCFIIGFKTEFLVGEDFKTKVDFVLRSPFLRNRNINSSGLNYTIF